MKFGTATDEQIDKKSLKKIIELFGDEGSQDESLLAVLNTTDSTKSATNSYNVITNKRVGIASDSKWGGLGEKTIFAINELSGIGVAYSYHQEQYGMNEKSYTYFTFRFYRASGEQYERHYFLGNNETEVNSERTFVLSTVQRLQAHGIQVFEDDGVESSEGISMGFGMGRFFDPDDVF
jgi:hypothetical protein